jgi:hypothetical protein
MACFSKGARNKVRRADRSMATDPQVHRHSFSREGNDDDDDSEESGGKYVGVCHAGKVCAS